MELKMNKTITKIATGLLLLTGLYTTAYAGAEVVVTLNTGAQFTWQFEEFEDAAEFMADRIEEGRCSPKVANLEIRSLYIDGLDDVEDKFSWYHGIEKQRING
jgi:hypothetical protein